MLNTGSKYSMNLWMVHSACFNCEGRAAIWVLKVKSVWSKVTGLPSFTIFFIFSSKPLKAS